MSPVFRRLSVAAIGLALLTIAVPSSTSPDAAASASPATSATRGASSCAATQWVGSWAASPNGPDTIGDFTSRALQDQTVRMVVRPTLSGSQARLRLTNRYHRQSVTLGAVTVAVRESGATPAASTVRQVLFGGSTSVTIRAGYDVLSDPLSFRVRAGEDLLVSIHVPGTVADPAQHIVTNQTSYLAPSGTGDHSADVDGAAFTRTTRGVFSTGWYFVAGLDVRGPRRIGSIVAFGDSITDGYQARPSGTESFAGLDRNVRYPDVLLRRVTQARPGQRWSVLNAGVSGNRLLRPDGSRDRYRTSAQRRFTIDALVSPGVTDVIVLIGTNDLTSRPGSRSNLLRGYRALISEARAARVAIHLATVPPLGLRPNSSAERLRQAINRWVRQQRLATSVIDADAALRDQRRPQLLRAAYDSGDGVHPSTAGYQRLAQAVRLGQLRGARC
ncbi:GDSL-type esterase/lipase family protein [Nocardioides sp. R-C-SC26]|uniref:GDSL-type esterase/lipase family protein n=1 Tax=Nocardioides sp. R-C-SC26 TaxID=2870414 RepID=UPI001E4AA84B|nr:GDSL-type esterase/lipase family protein [Nocardioides sp. R-C-SC26]